MSASNKSAIDFNQQDVEEMVSLTRFLYQFCQVKRSTFLPDGKTPENDAFHTIILAVHAISITAKYFPHLDSGLVVKFCIIHDLVEGYAGDTPTLQIDQTGRQDKDKREDAAFDRIEAEFGQSDPELIRLMYEYKRLNTPEARLVKMLDKLMPSLSHILNGGETIHRAGISREQYRADSMKRTQYYLSTNFGSQNPELMALRQAIQPVLEEAMFE